VHILDIVFCKLLKRVWLVSHIIQIRKFFKVQNSSELRTILTFISILFLFIPACYFLHNFCPSNLYTLVITNEL